MRRIFVISLSAISLLLGMVVPAQADHTNPREPLSVTEQSPPPEALTTGEGTWEYIFGLPPNPGTDLEIFKLARRLFISAGTLGGAPEQHVGQRLVRLTTRTG